MVSVSTKDVHGLWITMWMSDQYHSTSQHLTHCPIDRQHKSCNSREMRFFLTEPRMAQARRSHTTKKFFYVERTELCKLTGQS